MFEDIRSVIRQIPKGKVATYGQVAKLAGYPGAARQVVWTLKTAMGLPWYRVLGTGGRIRLPGHHGLEQRMRLEFEGVRFLGPKVDMKNFGWEPATAPSKARKQPKGAKKSSTRKTQENGKRGTRSMGKNK